ncbi:palmitoleoyl-protein carboxylesterase notum1-like [Mytilus galloprovincialis]|uniref:palmitoleoyl-protein carboxylesterase notum1-like n=1 Tax=Mytilus galloprovincialis TaxID=29158 RepID=UPI003F7CA3BC
MKKYIYTFWILPIVFVSCVQQPYNRIHDMPLDVNKLESLGNSDSLMKALKDIAQKSHDCGVKEVPKFRRYFLKNKTVTCNDGSPAGYYLRKSYGSKKWIVFLEGGWYCFDDLSCRLRWQNTGWRSYMSSNSWPHLRRVNGLLSSDPKENSYYFNANMVYIPYCSSDSWTGTVVHEDGYSFLGSYIIEEVIKELVPRGLKKAQRLILAGSSAGGTGVLMNLDRVADLMSELAPGVEVRGLADSGWFVDIPQFRRGECSDSFSCSPVDSIQRGVKLWKGNVPEACRKEYPEDEQWKCYFGYKMYPTLKTPVFIVQYLFDEAQISVMNLLDISHLSMNSKNQYAGIMSKEQWQYLHNLGEEVKKSLHNVSAVFAPACLSHVSLTKRDWQSVSVNGVTLAQSIYCWENNFEKDKCLITTSSSPSIPQTDPLLKDGPSVTKKPKRVRRRKKKKKKRKKKKKKKNKNKNKNKKRNRLDKEKRRRRRVRKRNRRKKGKKRSRAQRSAKNVGHCNHHVIESCPLPQWCNSFCPAFRNQFTGEVIDFFKLFADSDIDRNSIAEILGKKLSAEENSNPEEISKLLEKKFRKRSSLT